jgi:hypothetical protein
VIAFISTFICYLGFSPFARLGQADSCDTLTCTILLTTTWPTVVIPDFEKVCLVRREVRRCRHRRRRQVPRPKERKFTPKIDAPRN